MKILVGSSSAPDRGAGISSYCREITEAFIEQGHSVVYASPTPDSFSWLRNCNVKHVSTPFSNDMNQIVSNLLTCLSNERIDGVINNDNAVVQNLAPFCRVPFLSVGHLESTAIGAMLRHNINWVDYTVAISSDMQLSFMKRFNLPPHRFPLIYNGIKDRAFASIDKTQKNGNIRVVFGGGLIPRKGGDFIREILEKTESMDGVEFEVFGDLPKGIPLSLKNAHHVKFHGAVGRDEYLKAVSGADIFLMPSRAEGCPIALLEATAFGLLPIVSDGIGAMRWIVTNAQNGYVCRLDNWVDQCIEILKFLCNNQKELVRMKKESRRTYEKYFTAQETVDKLVHLLCNPVIDRRDPPSSARIIHWHRWPESTILQRINFRLGRIQKCGVFSTTSSADNSVDRPS